MADALDKVKAKWASVSYVSVNNLPYRRFFLMLKQTRTTILLEERWGHDDIEETVVKFQFMGGPAAVSPRGKLTTTWGRLKK
jgi:hypothetical protein